jgi:hypothetical protein
VSERRKFIIVNKDICPFFHGRSDFGFSNNEKPDSSGRIYSRATTSSVECYAESDGLLCRRNGKCVKVQIQKIPQKEK